MFLSELCASIAEVGWRLTIVDLVPFCGQCVKKTEKKKEVSHVKEGGGCLLW